MTLQSQRLFITWFTSGADGRSHAVTDEEATQACHGGRDARAVCGHSVTPVSLIVPPGGRCPRCELYVRARATMTGFDLQSDRRRHSHRKSLWCGVCSTDVLVGPSLRVPPERTGQSPATVGLSR